MPELRSPTIGYHITEYEGSDVELIPEPGCEQKVKSEFELTLR